MIYFFWSKKFWGQKNFWVKIFLSKTIFGSKSFFGSKKILGRIFFVKHFWVKNILWVKNNFGVKKICIWNYFCLKKTGRVNPMGRIYDPPPQKIVGLKLCWVVVGIAGWPCLQNFRPLGPFFLVELEFLGGGCKVIIVSNPTRLWLGCGWVVVRLGFWQQFFQWF